MPNEICYVMYPKQGPLSPLSVHLKCSWCFIFRRKVFLCVTRVSGSQNQRKIALKAFQRKNTIEPSCSQTSLPEALTSSWRDANRSGWEEEEHCHSLPGATHKLPNTLSVTGQQCVSKTSRAMWLKKTWVGNVKGHRFKASSQRDTMVWCHQISSTSGTLRW